MDLQMQDKTVLITGGDSGMGFETARILADEGVTLILSDKEQDEVDQRAEQLRKGGATVHAIAADLSSAEGANQLAQKIKDEFGGVDAVGHFAGITGPTGDFLELSDDDWRKTLEIDLMGAVRIARAFIPQMVEKGWGRLLFIASENALQPYPDETPYNSSKAGVIALSKGLSKAFAEEGVLVNTISPAFVETPMTDAMMEELAEEKDTDIEGAVQWFLENKRPHIEVKRRGQPEEVAAVAALLLSPLSSYVNGANWRVDGGSVASV